MGHAWIQISTVSGVGRMACQTEQACKARNQTLSCCMSCLMQPCPVHTVHGKAFTRNSDGEQRRRSAKCCLNGPHAARSCRPCHHAQQSPSRFSTFYCSAASC
jgi:hypothetical protein